MRSRESSPAERFPVRVALELLEAIEVRINATDQELLKGSSGRGAGTAADDHSGGRRHRLRPKAPRGGLASCSPLPAHHRGRLSGGRTALASPALQGIAPPRSEQPTNFQPPLADSSRGATAIWQGTRPLAGALDEFIAAMGTLPRGTLTDPRNGGRTLFSRQLQRLLGRRADEDPACRRAPDLRDRGCE
jgi:hypothetical protein